MTTPYQQGGLIGNLLGGVAGTLGGTNQLQQSIDNLTMAVNRLNTNVGGGGRLGAPTFGNQAGPAGTANGNAGGATVAPPTPFGKLALAGGLMSMGALANYGQQQMPIQLGLNAYATQSMMGMNVAANGGYSNVNAAFSRQAFGLGNQNLNNLAANPMDALGMTQVLQQAGYSPLYMKTALGRAAFGAATSFGFANPSLSGTQAAQLAQQMYSPQLSQRMLSMGYAVTPRRLGGGNPALMGNIIQGINRTWFNKNSVSPATLFANLQPGAPGYLNLQQGLGVNPAQFAPVMEAYNQMFQKGISPARATQLFSQYYGQNSAKSRQAGIELRNLGVYSVTSDIQKLKNNQSVLTGRSADIANGFNSALTASTDSLQKFNLALNSILNSTGMNNALGYGAGMSGTLSGTNHGNSLLGLGGMALMIRGLLGGGGLFGLGARTAGGAAGAAGGGAGGIGGLLGGLGLGGAAALGSMAAGGVGIGAFLRTLGDRMSPAGTQSGAVNNALQATNFGGNPITNILGGIGARLSGTISGLFGGAGGSVPQSSQAKAKNMMSNVSGAARGAVAAAEQEIGVPYQWGGESPGVGFDCSGLVQWAYKQAGVNLPRTSQQQWAALSKRAVPLTQVQEGDLVFMAGSDGTANSPGHVGMMINKTQLIQAPTTGQDVQIIGYNPRDWQHAARPSGNGAFTAGTTGLGGTGGPGSPGLYGNAGMGSGLGGNYGSVNEVDLINGMGGGGFMSGGASPALSNAAVKSPKINSITQSMTGGTSSKAVALAKQLAGAYGWSTGSNWDSLYQLWMHESGFRWNATNPQSGAYGIPQSLPGNKMASAGADWRTDPATQEKWGLRYIKGTYGSPDQAWAMWQSRNPHWYASGTGHSQPGLQIVGERGPELMMSAGGSTIFNNAQTMKLLKAIGGEPNQSPWKVMGNEAAANTGDHSGSSLGCIHLNFGQNAVQVHLSGALSSSSNVESVGKQFATAFANQLATNETLAAIRQGRKL